MKKISKKILDEIRFWSKKGTSLSEIKKKTGCGIGTISKYRAQMHGIYQKNVGGRKRILTNREECMILRAVNLGYLKNSHDIKIYIANHFSKKLSGQSVRNVLVKHGLKSYVRPFKPRLLAHHKRARRVFADNMLKAPEKFWEFVIFTDESKYNLYAPDCNRGVWRKPGSPSLDHHFRQVVKYGGGSIMVWGAITYHGVGKLAFIDGKMNSEKYISILSSDYVSSLDMYGLSISDTYMVQDNDPKHCSNVTKEWMDEHKLNVIPWASCSPDMNIIEHVWNDVDLRLRSREKQPTNFEELRAAIIEEWYNTPVSYIQALYHSIPRRLQALKDARGSHTKY